MPLISVESVQPSNTTDVSSDAAVENITGSSGSAPGTEPEVHPAELEQKPHGPDVPHFHDGGTKACLVVLGYWCT